jgi:hypothetical protein
MMDVIWITGLQNLGESIEITARVSKKPTNNDGHDYHLGFYVISEDKREVP